MSNSYFEQTSNPIYSEFIDLSRYARFRDDLGRREIWPETVKRYFDFFESHIQDNHPAGYEYFKAARPELEESVLYLSVMPSMRALMTAGDALKRDHVAGYNCSYLPIDDIRCFDELMYILLCGTGVGFSVEQKYVSKLPVVSEDFHHSSTPIVVPDSKIGWASSVREMISLLYAGRIPTWDTSRIRPAGARLKTFGGRASGPEPLENLFQFTVDLFKKAAGRRLTTLECHDLVCKIADVVVVGGVRRSALISLSDVSDERMRSAKSGQWWIENPQRALANNSGTYNERPAFDLYLKEMLSLYESKSGERGVFSRYASKVQAAKNGRRDADHDFGTNPCSEIILRAMQFCNLSEVVVRPGDSKNDLKQKVRLATILGTLQSTLTNFRYIRKVWKRNCEEERLLGVSLTGIMDHPVLNGLYAWNGHEQDGDKNSLRKTLDEMREVAVETNKEWAEYFGINQSAAITCVKPSGTVSQLCDTSSGIHPRYSRYYLRSVRADVKDPIAKFMIDRGFMYEKDRMNSNNYVFSFPVKSPEHTITSEEIGAQRQLDIWDIYQSHWCEHKPSMTCYYRDHEFLDVAAWTWKNFDKISGISYLPHSDHTYAQAPYIEITEEQYQEFLDLQPDPDKIDWTELGQYEAEDNTTGQQELACTANGCEL